MLVGVDESTHSFRRLKHIGHVRMHLVLERVYPVVFQIPLSILLALARVVFSFPVCNVHLNEGENSWLHKAACLAVMIDLHAESHPNCTSEVNFTTFKHEKRSTL